MSSDEIAIDVRHLSKRYEIYATPRDRLKQLVLPRLYRTVNRTAAAFGVSQGGNLPCYYREFWALRDVSFQVRRGETLGIIGRNGSGKSTLLQILAGTLASTSGDVKVKGRTAALLELGSGFNPEFTGRDNVFLNGRILGLSQKDIEARYDEIVAFADIGDFVDQPVKTYSSGMFLRLAFAVQAHIDASIVIIDEALAVGDVFFRQKCYGRLEQLRNSGAAILLVSHSMPDIEQYCERAILLDHGSQRFIGPASEATKHYYLIHQADKAMASSPVTAGNTASCTLAREHVIDRPPDEAFIDLSGKPQVSNGQARCVEVALCDDNAAPRNSFRQGDTAVFYYEFELAAEIGIPICGIVLVSDKSIIVHGKNSWQYNDDVPASLGPGTRVICQQQIKLDLAPGEYVFEVGLAAISAAKWETRSDVSHEEMAARHVRICHIPRAGAFSVALAVRNGVSVLTHHGIADLPGSMKIAVEGAGSLTYPRSVIEDSARAGNFQLQDAAPTVFHITHWKAGSQWMHKILRELAPERIVPPQLDEKRFLEMPVVSGAVYPTVYATKEQFHSVALPRNYRKFVIIRDLRDTLISGYFSIRYSHAVINRRLAKWREYLEATTVEAGLLMLIDEWLPLSARIQESWIDSGERIIRYEDLLGRDVEILEEVLIEQCQFDVSQERVREVIVSNRFENLTGGRKLGVEDISAHERKGVAGDWRNYFTRAVAEKFNEHYGALLVRSGYAFSRGRVAK